MPKIFPGSDPKQKHDRDIRKTVGVYDKPERTAISRNMVVALAVIVALLLLFVFYRLAAGQAPSEAQANRENTEMKYC